MNLKSMNKSQLVNRLLELENKLSLMQGNTTIEAKSQSALERYRKIFFGLPDGIIIEAEDRKIIQTNKKFCDLFRINASPEALVGLNCQIAVEQSKHLFKDPNRFLKRIEEILLERKPVNNEELELADGGFYERDYLPIETSIGVVEHLWHYRNVSLQKKTEKEMKLKTVQLNTFIESIPDLVWLKSPEGKYLKCNRKFEKHIGAKESDIIGKTDFDFMNFEQAKFYQNNDNMAIKLGKPYINEDKITYAEDGHIEFLETIKTPIYDSQQKLIGVLGIARDITERKSIEQELIENKNKLDFIIRHSKNMFYSHTRDHILTYISPQSRQILDCEPEEAMIKWQDFLSDNPVNKQGIKLTEQAIKSGTAQSSYELELVTMKGRKVWVLVNESPVTEKGKTIAIVGSLTDITARKLAEQEIEAAQKLLVENETRLRTLINSTPDIICFKDGQGRWLESNEANLKLFSLTKLKYRGKKDSELAEHVPQNLREAFINCEESDERAWQLKRMIRSEEIIKQPDGTLKVLDVIKVPAFYPDGSRKSLVVWGRDITEIKNTELALTESEKKFRVLAENIPGVIYSCKNDERWTMFYLNNKVEELTGYAKEDFLSDKISFADLYHPSDKEHVYSEVEKALNGKKPFNLTYRIKHKNGNWICIEEFGLGVYKDEKLVFLEGVLIDITERKLAEQKISENEKRYRSLVEDSPLSVIVHSKGRIVYLNNTALKMIKAESEDQVKNKSIMEFVHPDYHNIVTERVQRLYDQKSSAETLEEKFICMDGSVIDVEVTAKIVEFEGKPASQVIVQDITSRKKAEESLRLNEERMRVALSNLPVIVFNQDLGLKYTWIANPNKLFSNVDIINKTDYDLLTMHEAEKLNKIKRKVLKSGKGTREEIEIQINGNSHFYDLIIEPLMNTENKIVGITCASFDMTEKKKLESQLNQAQKMEAIGRLAGGVAHDFNNILTVINGYTDLMLASFIPDNVKKPLEQIQKAGKRAARLTEQLLAFSRKQVIKPEIINLNKIIIEHMSILRRILREDIEIKTLLAPDLGNINMDPVQVEQVILNICVNARDAMPSGGKLTIETKNCEFDEKYINNHPEAKMGKYIMLEISDSGVGMSQNTMSNIFEPFFTTKELDKGTGLGLAMVYGIVKQNQGFIFVYSEPGKGASFKIYFPMINEKNDQNQKEIINDADLHGEETILIVEDDENVMEVTESALKSYGYNTITAVNGKKAIEIFKKHASEINLVLTDVIMPEMGGKELIKNLIALNPGLKVIYFSGYSDNSIVNHGILDENIEYIQKPFAIEKLLLKIRSVLDINS